ncbi:potassium channel family protein [Propionibacteriaceae bacterium Y2011]|uniref:potassium channel family protein n=1 Tax=Microlunatus sp. Y2014 TaxID=3418488 RepID=UPI003B4E2E01
MSARDVRTGREYVSDALIRLPFRRSTPLVQLGQRAALAGVLLVLIVAMVWLDRDGYTDNSDGTVNLVDALYYSTVTITTTGYGDITPVALHSRLINAFIVTPMRITFLVLLVGTTLEVLANQGRRIYIDARWRKRMRNHVVVIGYGTKGRAAVQTMIRNEVDLTKVVVIDGQQRALDDASRDGVAALQGDATRRELLQRAEISKAREIIITLDRDDSAILTTLTVRRLNPSAHVVVACREHDNASLLRQSGADAVVTSSDAVGRLLGLSAVSPNLGTVIEDILSSGEGLEVFERLAAPDEVGRHPSEIEGEQVVAVVRNKTLRRFYDPAVAELQTGDHVIVVRQAPEDQ